MDLLIEIAANLCDAVFCVYFISKFCNASFKKDKLFIPVIGVIILLVYAMISDYYFAFISIVATFLYLILYVAYGLLVCNKKYLLGILSGVLFEIALVLINTITYAIISNTINDFDSALQTGTATRYIWIITAKISLFAGIMLILKLFKSKKAIDLLSGILSFVLTLTTVIGLGMSISIAAKSGGDKSIESSLIWLSLMFILINVVFYIIIVRMQKLIENTYKVKLLEDKMAFEIKRIEDTEETYNKTKMMRHDMKNHLSVLLMNLENGKIEESKDYLKKLLPQIEKMGQIIRTDNKTLEYIINSKLGGLEKTKIIISGSTSDLSDIDETDLACLFGNLLDNAVEGIKDVPQEEKQIELHFDKQGSMRMILCKNTINGSVLESNKSLSTTKKDKGTHGYGIKIIEKIVNDYEGMIKYYEEYGMFCVQILLPKE